VESSSQIDRHLAGDAEAKDRWRQYLASDAVSELAGRARRSLKFCEIQINSVAGVQTDTDRAA
jgi:hypothetical protein